MKELRIVNIKKLLNKQLELPDAGAIAVIGGNGTGKSTVIQCMQAILLAKNFIVNPITEGQESGSIEYTGKDVKGNAIVVRMDIEKDGDSTVSAVYYDPESGKNRKVSNVSVIRELLGNYFPLTVHQVFSMLKYTEGRREFFDKYITRLIDKEQLERIKQIDAEISTKESSATRNNLFFTRRGLQKKQTEEQAILKSFSEQNIPKFTREQLTSAKEQGLAKLQKLKDEQTVRLQNQKISERLLSIARDIDNGIEYLNRAEYSIPEFLTDCRNACIHEAVNIYNPEKAKDIILNQTEEERIIREKLDKVTAMLVEWEHVEKAEETKFNLIKSIRETEAEITKISDRIEKLREERANIIQSSNFPSGMTIDDEYNIFIDGILFNESSISETMARTYIIKMLLKIAGGSFIDIGDWSLYDATYRKTIVDLAKENNCLLMGQYVTDQDEVTVKTIG